MLADNTSAGLSVLAACTTDVRQWYMQNGLQLNTGKSEALIVGTAHQLRAATSTVSSISVADVNLPLANEMKVLGVILDRHLTDENHVSAVARSCNYHIQAIRHIRHLLSTQLAQTLACSLILSRLDYCNAVLHGIPRGNIQKLQPRVQNSAAWIVLQEPRRSHTKPLLRQLHWLPVQHRITYKLAVLAYKVRTTSTPAYLSRHIRLRDSVLYALRSATTTRLSEPFASTAFAKSEFRCSAPATWNSLPQIVTDSNSLGTFKSRLKSHLFSRAHNWYTLPSASASEVTT